MSAQIIWSIIIYIWFDICAMKEPVCHYSTTTAAQEVILSPYIIIPRMEHCFLYVLLHDLFWV